MLEKQGQGQPITASFLNSIRDAVMKMIVPGRGISIRKAGSQVAIDVIDTPKAIGAGGQSVYVIVASADELPTGSDIKEWKKARVVGSGTDNGREYERNLANNGWRAFNFIG